MTSGARYHLVATYSVIYAFPPPAASGGGCAEERARPKSQIWETTCQPRGSIVCERGRERLGRTLRSQLALSKRLDGLRSRCKTSAVWRAFRPLTVYPALISHAFRRGGRETYLIDKVLAVIVAQLLRPDHSMTAARSATREKREEEKAGHTDLFP